MYKVKYLFFGTIFIGLIFILFTAGCGSDGDQLVDNEKSEVKDADGNVYHTVVIGTQTWMVENLKTTKYNDGAPIPLVTDNSAWGALSTPGFCWYKNDKSSYENPYGALYNWYAVETGKLAPNGWHVATDADWTALAEYLGGANIAGAKLKESGTTHWKSPNNGGTNETGFTAIPTPGRQAGGQFSDDTNSYSYWWIAPKKDGTDPWYLSIYHNGTNISKSSYINWKVGFSVRCIKD
jgi:uncharacterized protein (TIGR02145 family)